MKITIFKLLPCTIKKGQFLCFGLYIGLILIFQSAKDKCQKKKKEKKNARG